MQMLMGMVGRGRGEGEVWQGNQQVSLMGGKGPARGLQTHPALTRARASSAPPPLQVNRH